MSPPHALPFPRRRRRNETRAIGSGGQLSDFPLLRNCFHYQGTAAVDTRLSSIGWRRGPGRAPVDAPFSGSLPIRSSRGESESLRLLDRHSQSRSEKVLTLILVSLLTSAATCHAAEQDPRMVAPPNAVRGRLPSSAPTPAGDATKTFRVLDGFRMDLLAAEPLVASPVAMAYDENGRAYVCEMRDYPYTDKAHHKPNQENPTDAAIGVVRLLEDTDGDGVFDKSTIFADGLSWPTGVACWKGGVYVAATPDIWYFKDTDGDGVADERR